MLGRHFAKRVFSVSEMKSRVSAIVNPNGKHSSSETADEIDSIEEIVSKKSKAGTKFDEAPFAYEQDDVFNDYYRNSEYTVKGRRVFDVDKEISSVHKMVEGLSTSSDKAVEAPRGDSPEIVRIAGNEDYNWFLIPFFYFNLGAYLATPSLAFNYYAMNVLNIDSAGFGSMYSIVALPWFLKPIYGYISDKYPLFGLHRIPYILLCSCACFLTWVLLAIPGPHSRSIYGFGALLILSHFFMCFSDVIVDCMVARVAREEKGKQTGHTIAMVWFMRDAGSFFGTILGSWLVANVHSTHFIFAITSLYPLAFLFGSLFLTEPRRSVAVPAEQSLSTTKVIDVSKKIAGDRTLLKLAIFVFVFAATPNSSAAFRYYLIERLKMTPAFMGYVSVASNVASLCGTVAYKLFFTNISTRFLTRTSVVIGTMISAMPMMLVTGYNQKLGMRNEYFVLGDDVAESFSGKLAQIPFLAAIASACPDGNEGLVYSGFMSISNIGGATSSLSGAFLTRLLGIGREQYTNLWILLLICTVTGFVPFFMVCWLPDIVPEKESPNASKEADQMVHKAVVSHRIPQSATSPPFP